MWDIYHWTHTVMVINMCYCHFCFFNIVVNECVFVFWHTKPISLIKFLCYFCFAYSYSSQGYVSFQRSISTDFRTYRPGETCTPCVIVIFLIMWYGTVQMLYFCREILHHVHASICTWRSFGLLTLFNLLSIIYLFSRKILYISLCLTCVPYIFTAFCLLYFVCRTWMCWTASVSLLNVGLQVVLLPLHHPILHRREVNNGNTHYM